MCPNNVCQTFYIILFYLVIWWKPNMLCGLKQKDWNQSDKWFRWSKVITMVQKLNIEILGGNLIPSPVFCLHSIFILDTTKWSLSWILILLFKFSLKSKMCKTVEYCRYSGLSAAMIMTLWQDGEEEVGGGGWWLVLCSAPSVPQPVVQFRRRPLLGPSPGWKRLLALSHLRDY